MYTISDYAEKQIKNHDMELNDKYCYWYMFNFLLQNGDKYTHYHGFNSENFDEKPITKDDVNIVCDVVRNKINIIDLKVQSYESIGFMTEPQLQSVIDFEKLNAKYKIYQ